MKAKAIKAFLHDELGSVKKGQEFEATAAQLGAVLPFVEILDAGKEATKAKPAAPAKPK